jgi:hypothetical protein
MSVVDLTEQEWNLVMTLLATHPWNQVNGLLMNIGSQLHRDRMGPNATPRLREQPDQRANPSRVQAAQSPANSGHSPEQRETGPGEG